MSPLEPLIRDVPNFPAEGIVFKDITPLLADAAGLKATIEGITEPFLDAGIDLIVGTESRGFIFGTAAAVHMGVGFAPVRKPGKLPWETISVEYDLEYGSDSIEIHTDAVKPGQKVLMIDDLLATGGTMGASCRLVEKLGGEIVGVSFVVELCFLNGRDRLGDYPIHSLIKVNGE